MESISMNTARDGDRKYSYESPDEIVDDYKNGHLKSNFPMLYRAIKMIENEVSDATGYENIFYGR